jgi:hypothetical protein
MKRLMKVRRAYNTEEFRNKGSVVLIKKLITQMYNEGLQIPINAIVTIDGDIATLNIIVRILWNKDICIDGLPYPSFIGTGMKVHTLSEFV